MRPSALAFPFARMSRAAGTAQNTKGRNMASIIRKRKPLTQERLKQVLIYDPDTGIFIRNGKIAGSRDRRGYTRITIDGVKHWAHRLAFLYMTGDWPVGFCDHINQKKNDDRWGNLRDASRAQNSMNRPACKLNSTGFKGVSVWPRGGYQAGIKVNGKRRYLGIFSDPIEAAKAYDAEATKEFGEFASLNFEARHSPKSQQGSLGI